jgi:uncharacterized protein YuzE
MAPVPVRVTADPAASAVYVAIGDGRASARQQQLDGRVIIDFAADGTVTGIEILGAVIHADATFEEHVTSAFPEAGKPWWPRDTRHPAVRAATRRGEGAVPGVIPLGGRSLRRATA